MSTISIIGSGGMAAAIGGLATKAGHTVEVTSRDAAKARALEHVCLLSLGLLKHSVKHPNFAIGVSLLG